MRPALIVSFCLIFSTANCASVQKSLLDGVRYILPFIGDASADEEEMKKEKQSKARIQKAVEYLKKTAFTDPVLFHNYRTLDPDEGGGVSIEIAVWNSTPQVIDRMEIVVQAMDEDNEPHLLAKKPNRILIKGPVASHKSLVEGAGKNNPTPFVYTVRNVWWNDSIACSLPSEVVVFYGNGKESRLTGDSLQAAFKFTADDGNLCL